MGTSFKSPERYPNIGRVFESGVFVRQLVCYPWITPTTCTPPTGARRRGRRTKHQRLKDLRGVISLYDTATSQGTRLNQYHFNALLCLCSNSVTEPLLKGLALEHGFRIFDQMLAININPNKSSITTVARLTAAKGDGDYAFELLKSMGKYEVVPRLRTYEPALLRFCENSEAVNAYE